MRLLFVSNGHGEIAIADRLAQEVRKRAPDVWIDHLPLVGESRATFMNEVGPRRQMPSGGLIAMGNLRNIFRDVSGGLIGLTFAQRAYLKQTQGQYDAAVAIGDVYALLMTLAANVPTTFVGTAKSVLVAPYGPMERRVLKRARRIFVRDSMTAQALQKAGIEALAPGNVIVDLFAGDDDPRVSDALDGFEPAVALFPGSRDAAYADGEFLLRVMYRAAQLRPKIGAAFSVAPLLDPARFARGVAKAGFTLRERADERIPFEGLVKERVVVRAWRGPVGPLLPRVQLVAGQAGTANEAAAAAGVAVVAFERGGGRRTAWYRKRQQGLLGEALAIVDGNVDAAALGIVTLLDDETRRAHMGEVGRVRMGKPGGAAAIAGRILEDAR